MNYFFVCGAPKSGTTWLQRILDAHPEIFCSGEGHFISRFSIPSAKVVNAYNQGLAVEAEHVYEGRPYYDPVDQSEFDDIVRAFVTRRLQSRATRETRWVGDKTPAYTHQLEALLRLFPEAKVFHIVRDPREVAVSNMGHSKRAGYTEAFIEGSAQHAQTIEAVIRNWTNAIDAVDAFSDMHPGVVHELQYGDLHADPIGETTRIFQFLGATTLPILIERVVAATAFETLAGRPAGEEDETSFLRKGVPGDWRSRLPEASARRVVEGCAEPMRRKRLAA